MLSVRKEEKNNPDTISASRKRFHSGFSLPHFSVHCRGGYTSYRIKQKPLSAADRTSTGTGTEKSEDNAGTAGEQPQGKFANSAPKRLFLIPDIDDQRFALPGLVTSPSSRLPSPNTLGTQLINDRPPWRSRTTASHDSGQSRCDGVDHKIAIRFKQA